MCTVPGSGERASVRAPRSCVRACPLPACLLPPWHCRRRRRRRGSRRRYCGSHRRRSTHHPRGSRRRPVAAATLVAATPPLPPLAFEAMVQRHRLTLADTQHAAMTSNSPQRPARIIVLPVAIARAVLFCIYICSAGSILVSVLLHCSVSQPQTERWPSNSRGCNSYTATR